MSSSPACDDRTLIKYSLYMYVYEQEWRVESGERMERKAGEREGVRNQKTPRLETEDEAEAETERR